MMSLANWTRTSNRPYFRTCLGPSDCCEHSKSPFYLPQTMVSDSFGLIVLRCWLISMNTTVVFLPFADEILSIGHSGTIREQGSYEQLRNGSGYVKELLTEKRIDEKFTLPRADIDIKPGKDRAYTGHNSSENTQRDSNNIRGNDITRQLGDTATYRFYFSCLGWGLAAIFWTLQCCYAFFMVFPSKQSSYRTQHHEARGLIKSQRYG